MKPAVISLALTNRCNSHCIMCNIWKKSEEIPNLKSLEIPGNHIIKILSQPLFSELVEIDLTGGEPNLRDDLADTVLGVARLKPKYLPRLRSIIITSNGLLPQRVITNYQKILEGLKDTKIDLVTVSSLDGIGKTHDQIRGINGAFELATKTIAGLLELKRVYSGYYTGIKTTVLPANIHQLDEILDFALQKNLFHIISPVFFTESRFCNTEKRKELTLKKTELEEFMKFLNRHKLDTSYFYSRAISSCVKGKKQWMCTAMYNYLFIDFDGKVYPCELLPTSIGDIKERDIADIWYSTLADHWRKRIDKMECCRECLEPGAIHYSAYTEGLSYLHFIKKLGKKRFGESLYGEGFDKYFGD